MESINQENKNVIISNLTHLFFNLAHREDEYSRKKSIITTRLLLNWFGDSFLQDLYLEIENFPPKSNDPSKMGKILAQNLNKKELQEIFLYILSIFFVKNPTGQGDGFIRKTMHNLGLSDKEVWHYLYIFQGSFNRLRKKF